MRLRIEKSCAAWPGRLRLWSSPKPKQKQILHLFGQQGPIVLDRQHSVNDQISFEPARYQREGSARTSIALTMG
jgi:hypothetical protein